MFRHALFVMALLISILGCRAAQEPAAVPAEFHGHWTTHDPRYEGRAFDLTVNTITLLNGDEGKASYPVRKFERTQEGGVGVYCLTYVDPAEGTMEVLLFWHDQGNGVIRFKNQRSIEWKKGAES